MGDAPTGPVVDGEGERPTPATAGSILVEAGRRQLDNAGTWILAGLCWAAIAFGLVGLGYVFVLLMWTAAAGTGDNRGEQVGILAVAATLFAAVAIAVVLSFQQRLALAEVDGLRPALRDGLPPRRVVGLSVLVTVGIVVGTVASGAMQVMRTGVGDGFWPIALSTLVPLVLLYLVAFAPAVMLDRDVGLIRALGAGVRLAFVRPFQWLLVVLAVWVLILLGAALYVGVVVTIPFAVLAVTVAYRRFSGPIPGNA